MPDLVARYEDDSVQPYVISLPNGATKDDEKAAVANLGPGWHLDKDSDAQSVALETTTLPLDEPVQPTSTHRARRGPAENKE